MRKSAVFAAIIMFWCAAAFAGDDKPEPKAQSLDMVSDTVAGCFKKANALLAGELEITMNKDGDKKAAKEDFTINAMGQKVPTRTAIKSGSALHNDDPL